MKTTSKNANKVVCNGCDTLTALQKENANLLKIIATLTDKIDASGYLEVEGIVRRWLPSQCLNMFYSPDGFHASLLARGYDYSWKVLINELYAQYKIWSDKDYEAFGERNAWYNSKIAEIMATDYIVDLQCYIDSLLISTEDNGRKYKKLRVGDKEIIYLDDLSLLYTKLFRLMEGITNAKTYRAIYKAVVEFDKERNSIGFIPKNRNMSSAFVNAYKAAGAYFTMKDLIMFENCYMCNINNANESLDKLKTYAKSVVKEGVASYGYKMLGLFKNFLEYNSFDFEKTKEQWKEQSETRKTIRNAKRNERRSRN